MTPDPFALRTYREEWEHARDEGRARNPVVPPRGGEMRLPRADAPEAALFGKYYGVGLGKAGGTGINLLTYNAKLNCMSIDLPSRLTCPGAPASMAARLPTHLGICWLCYAGKGTQEAFGRTRNFQRMVFSQGEDFADTMVEALSTEKNQRSYGPSQVPPMKWQFFRIHSSGDFYSAEYIRKWIDICTRLPRIRFWAPTRVWAAPAQMGLMAPLAELAALKNVTIRPSALVFDAKPTGARAPFAAGAGVYAHRNFGAVLLDTLGFQPKWTPLSKERLVKGGCWPCPALLADDAKADGSASCTSTGCRKCWDSPRTRIIYAQH